MITHALCHRVVGLARVRAVREGVRSWGRPAAVLEHVGAAVAWTNGAVEAAPITDGKEVHGLLAVDGHRRPSNAVEPLDVGLWRRVAGFHVDRRGSRGRVVVPVVVGRGVLNLALAAAHPRVHLAIGVLGARVGGGASRHPRVGGAVGVVLEPRLHRGIAKLDVALADLSLAGLAHPTDLECAHRALLIGKALVIQLEGLLLCLCEAINRRLRGEHASGT
mmetsp:Transcript_118143/g.314379  ORF Transcript_118143/g.314379 Transcript_118143/m.314379 type:complete len:220 (+) Transcript_118143:1285-1944(+)